MTLFSVYKNLKQLVFDFFENVLFKILHLSKKIGCYFSFGHPVIFSMFIYFFITF